MPQPYPNAVVYNRELQWAGGNPAQSHLASMEINPSTGRIYWGAGVTLVGGLNIQAFLVGDVFIKTKITEQAVGRYTGFSSCTDPNGKFHFSTPVSTQKMQRFNNDGTFDAETAAFTAANIACDNAFNRMDFNVPANFLYLFTRNTVSGQQSITHLNYNTMAVVGHLSYAGTASAGCSIAQDPFWTGKVFGTDLPAQLTRFLASPTTIDVNLAAAPQTDFREYIYDPVNTKIWAASKTSGSLKRFHPNTMVLENTTAYAGASVMFISGNYLFLYQNTGQLSILNLTTFVVDQVIPGLIVDVGAVRANYIRYHAASKTIVISNTNNPGSNNVSFIDLDPPQRRARRSGGELWAMIPELKDYLG